MAPLARALLIYCALYPVCQSAEEAPLSESWFRILIERSIIRVGVGFRSDEITVTDDALNGEGQLVNERGFQPSLSIGFENAYFGESNWGYSAVLGYTQFDMDKQKIGNDVVDLGTSAEGELFYLAPSVFYNWGSKHYDGGYFKLGGALGIGYLRTKGDVLLTDLSGNPRHSFDIKSDPISASVGLFAETGYKDWFLRLQVAGPVVEEEDREISGATVGLTFGYTFHLFN